MSRIDIRLQIRYFMTRGSCPYLILGCSCYRYFITDRHIEFARISRSGNLSITTQQNMDGNLHLFSSLTLLWLIWWHYCGIPSWGEYLFPCSPKLYCFVPLFPKTEILISQKLPVPFLDFIPFFPKMPLFSWSQKPMGGHHYSQACLGENPLFRLNTVLSIVHIWNSGHTIM